MSGLGTARLPWYVRLWRWISTPDVAVYEPRNIPTEYGQVLDHIRLTNQAMSDWAHLSMADITVAVTSTDGWHKIGSVAVDSGCLNIVDPCYVVPQDEWSGFLDSNPDVKLGRFKECTVVLNGFGGDGCYPVYVRRNKDGLEVEARIVFHEQDWSAFDERDAKVQS